MSLKSDLSSRNSLHPLLKKFVAYEDEFWESSPLLPLHNFGSGSENRLSRINVQSIGQLINILNTMYEKFDLKYQKLLETLKNNKSTRGSIRRESNAIAEIVAQLADKVMQILTKDENTEILKKFSGHIERLESYNNGLASFAGLNVKGKIEIQSEDAEYASHSFKQRISETLYRISTTCKDVIKGFQEYNDGDD